MTTANAHIRAVPTDDDDEFRFDVRDQDRPDAHLAAEAAVLGAAILSADARAGMIARLVGDDFELEGHRMMARTIAELHVAGVHVDPVTINDQLTATGRVEVVGGLGSVFELTDPACCPHPAAWEHYAGIVAREGQRRRLVRACRRAVDRLEDGADVSEITTDLAVVLDRKGAA